MAVAIILSVGIRQQSSNKSVEPINYPAGNLLAHFKRYVYKYSFLSLIFYLSLDTTKNSYYHTVKYIFCV